MGALPPTLDNLLNDSRLERLFSKDARHCALQLWILQIKSEQSVENRIVYGRLLPYGYSSDSWSASDDDVFHTFGKVQAQLIKLNLYVKSAHCAELLRQLSVGKNVSEISGELNLGLSDKLKARFGTVALPAANLVFRPVAYLLNRDAHERRSLLSPHDGAGAFSASVSQADKGALFRLGQYYDVALTASVVQHLNADTGLDFGGVDCARFGDLELLVFPTLDEQERSLLDVDWTATPLALVARFNPMQVPHFTGFQFRLSILNDGQIVSAGLATAERDVEGMFVCRLEVSEQLRKMTDETELEIFGSDGEQPHQGMLCCRWRIVYIRELHFQMHMAGHSARPVKFDWLEKATRPSASARVKAALTVKRGNLDSADHIGGREADPWVPVNRDLTSLFARLHPLKSEGRFFLRWSQEDGEGRLQFVEWFKGLLTKHQQHQVVIFDPYFEDAGLGLVLLCATEKSDYIVFRSLPKVSTDKPAPSWIDNLVAYCAHYRHLLKRIKLRIFRSLLKESSEEVDGKPCAADKPAPSGVDNLLANCERNSQFLKRIKLRIYGLKEGRLHDRYILVMGSDGLPVAGFHLSNSFQTVAQNYPLLITPIPPDVLLQVERYMSGLVQEAEAAKSEDENANPSMRLLFDSTAAPAATRRYEPLKFLEKDRAGDVLSALTGTPSLQGLCGDPLRKQMAAHGLLKENSLVLSGAEGLRTCQHLQGNDPTTFSAMWDVLGDILAHSHIEADIFREFESRQDGLELLARFLEAAFNRTHDELNKELVVPDSRFFREPIEALLHSPYHPHHFFHATKYGVLTWAEYYAIKLLWHHAPDALIGIAETQLANVSEESQRPDAIRLSLLSQIVSEVSLAIEFEIGKEQRDCLLRSSHGLLHWLGLNAVERELEKPDGLAAVRQLVATYSGPKQVQALGWMVAHAAIDAARDSKKAEVYKGLVEALHGALPKTISSEELKRLVDSLRGHMRQLCWAEPWLFQDVVFPLLQNDHANADDACKIWIQELTALLGSEQDHSRLFERSREGQTTNIAAFLFANSSHEQQQGSLKSMKALLRRQQRIVQQPLASTSDWSRWNDALVVSMWILTFARWSLYYLREGGMANNEMENLSQGARNLALAWPMDEWRSQGEGQPGGELAAFLDQVDELMVSNAGPEDQAE